MMTSNVFFDKDFFSFVDHDLLIEALKNGLDPNLADKNGNALFIAVLEHCVFKFDDIIKPGKIMNGLRKETRGFPTETNFFLRKCLSIMRTWKPAGKRQKNAPNLRNPGTRQSANYANMG